MQVITGVSNRHIHITEEDFNVLFKDTKLEMNKPLLQSGEFASNLTVSIKTEKKTIDNVRILGPFRNYTQVEISRTDAYALGINPPVRNSGDLKGGATITIIGKDGEITKDCCIIANRHLHINKEDRQKYGLTNIEKVVVSFNTEKSVIFKDVYVKESPMGVLEFHIDTDDANGSLINTGDMATIYIDK